ncbi:MAG: Crp/Fnr family transcriptional regulator [Lutibacter sp.]
MKNTNHSILNYFEKLYIKNLNSKEIKLISFEKNNDIFSQGKRLNKILILKKGVSKCYISEENGKEFLIDFLSEGDVVGEIEAIKNIPCLCSVKALTDIEVFQISTTFFIKLLHKDLVLANLLNQLFANRVVKTSARASYQQLYSADKSLDKLLKLINNYELKLTKDDMATYLGISFRSLNRLLKNRKE